MSGEYVLKILLTIMLKTKVPALSPTNIRKFARRETMIRNLKTIFKNRKFQWDIRDGEGELRQPTEEEFRSIQEESLKNAKLKGRLTFEEICAETKEDGARIREKIDKMILSHNSMV
ncbi:hypothetical protein MLD52_09675 [Puniceicoccaceae bacterium K14]|nr:hypothetical protein [Puniceicoccaceae bacterium K14]